MEIVKDVVGNHVARVDLGIVELGRSALPIELRCRVYNSWLVLHGVGDKHVLAEISGKSRAPVDLHLEVDGLPKQFLGLIDKEFEVTGLFVLLIEVKMFAVRLAGPVGDGHLTTVSGTAFNREDLGFQLVF